MDAPIERFFPSWASLFVDKKKDEPRFVDARKELFQLHFPTNASKNLILGIPRSGKTALLFQYALSSAMDGCRVVFITQRKLESMPLSVNGAPRPDPMLMKRVNILYYEDRLSFLQYLAGIHTAPVLPEVIVVDNLDYYVTHPKTTDQTATISSLCAYLVDAATFLTNKRFQPNTDGNSDLDNDCQILASVSTQTSGEFPLESTYAYFLPSVLRIRDVKGPDSVFQLTTPQQNGAFQKDLTFTYKITDCIRLLDITDGGVAMYSRDEPTQESHRAYAES